MLEQLVEQMKENQGVTLQERYRDSYPSRSSLQHSLPVWMENMFRLQRQSADLRRFLKESMMMYRRVIS